MFDLTLEEKQKTLAKGNYVPICPMCRKREPDYIYMDSNGDPIGCTKCIKTIDPYDFMWDNPDYSEEE